MLDESSATSPVVSGTWFVSLVCRLVRRGQSGEKVVEESEEGNESDTMTAVGETGRRAPASKVGGRRRRAVHKR